VREVKLEGHGLLADRVVVHLRRDELHGVGTLVKFPSVGGLDCIEALEEGLNRGRELLD
jgi:hypothetical protein